MNEALQILLARISELESDMQELDSPETCECLSKEARDFQRTTIRVRVNELTLLKSRFEKA